MKAYNIKWDIDIDDAIDTLDEMTSEDAAKVLELPEKRYANMTTSDRYDYAYSYFERCHGAMEGLFRLPNSVEIPKDMSDEDEISDWLSDEYGFCHAGFELDTD